MWNGASQVCISTRIGEKLFQNFFSTIWKSPFSPFYLKHFKCRRFYSAFLHLVRFEWFHWIFRIHKKKLVIRRSFFFIRGYKFTMAMAENMPSGIFISGYWLGHSTILFARLPSLFVSLLHFKVRKHFGWVLKKEVDVCWQSFHCLLPLGHGTLNGNNLQLTRIRSWVHTQFERFKFYMTEIAGKAI